MFQNQQQTTTTPVNKEIAITSVTTATITTNSVVNTANQTIANSDPVHDLPSHLLQQGWRKFWSKREKRPYYFNKITNESLWDMPEFGATPDPLTDPLGIQSPVPVTPPPPPTNGNNVFQQWPVKRGEKRSLSVDESFSKKIAISGPFDLEVPSNVIILQRPESKLFHCHPDIELFRCSLLMKLRQQYNEICHSRESIDAPKDSFHRWLIERKVVDKGSDPLLPSNCFPEVSRSMYNEIMNDIPVRLVQVKFIADAKKQLVKYAEAAKRMIESRNTTPESRKVVKWSVEEVFQFIRTTRNANFDEYEERLAHLRSQCQPHLSEAAKSSIEGICSKIYHMSCEYAKKVREKELELLKQENIQEVHGIIKLQNPKRVFCYPVQIIHQCPKLPSVHYMYDKDLVLLRYKGEILKIKGPFVQKLEHLYRWNCTDDRKFEYFLTRVWCLLKRYQGFISNSSDDAFSTQVSLPTTVFECLNKHFDVTFECFSSPLNCYFRQYCSQFSDTDSYFGSRGSFLNFFPLSGSLQAFPPYCEELLESTVDHIEKLLSVSEEPLSFVLFLQQYREDNSRSIIKLESSRFKRKQLIIEPLEHNLRNPNQHVCDQNQIHLKSPHKTTIIFLQNDAGFLRWGPTPQRIDALYDAFKLSKETLPLLSPPPTPQSVSTSTTLNPSNTVQTTSDKDSI